MRIIAKGTLRDYWLLNPSAEYSLMDWYDTTKKATWESPNEVKATYGNASIVGNSRVVFNIEGNDFRLITKIDYEYQFVFIIWIGTHKEYDRIDVTTIEYNGYHSERKAPPPGPESGVGIDEKFDPNSGRK